MLDLLKLIDLSCYWTEVMISYPDLFSMKPKTTSGVLTIYMEKPGIQFEKLQKTCAVIWGSAIFLLFLVCKADLDILLGGHSPTTSKIFIVLCLWKRFPPLGDCVNCKHPWTNDVRQTHTADCRLGDWQVFEVNIVLKCLNRFPIPKLDF